MSIDSKEYGVGTGIIAVQNNEVSIILDFVSNSVANFETEKTQYLNKVQQDTTDAAVEIAKAQATEDKIKKELVK